VTGPSLRKARSAYDKLDVSFFGRPAIDVAQALIGKILVHRVRDHEYRARIVETEAYLGPDDLASHASKGRTKRTEVMFGPPGRAYVYLIYGIYDMLNVVVGTVGEAQAVLIRGAQPLDDWTTDLSGPGRLTRAFQITRADNGLDLTGDRLFFLNDPSCRPRLISGKRVGVDYAKEWKDRPFRFLDLDRVSRRVLRSCAVARELSARHAD
jgi:DNA-3-methyladenine glycosylase